MQNELNQSDVSEEAVISNQRLMAAIERLSKYNGKMEVKFMTSDNEQYNKVCLAFIKFPLIPKLKSPLKECIIDYEKVPLSIGRLSVERAEHITLFTGAIRVKQLSRMGNVIYGLVDKMVHYVELASAAA
jgi:hypothetical protein